MSALPFRKPEAGRTVAETSASAHFGPASALTIPGVVPASRLEVRPAPAVVSTGIATLDALTGGLPRGALTEILGPASSGRTSTLVSVLAAMTARGEVCALVDACESFAPESAQSAGVELAQVLWVRCGTTVASRQSPVARRPPVARNSRLEIGNFSRLEQALQATDLLLQSGGFGLVAVDLGDIPPQAARRVPLTSWFRFRRAVENTPTVLLLVARESCAKTCASVVIQLSAISHQQSVWQGPTDSGVQHEEPISLVFGRSPEPGARSHPPHAELLTEICVRAELVRSRGERKPVRAAIADFETRAPWA